MRRKFDFIKTTYCLSSRPYCKLQTEFFRTDLLPEREASPSGKKRGSVTYKAEQENEVSKIFIISLSLNGGRGRVQFKQTFEFSEPYRPLD